MGGRLHSRSLGGLGLAGHLLGVGAAREESWLCRGGPHLLRKLLVQEAWAVKGIPFPWVTAPLRVLIMGDLPKRSSPPGRSRAMATTQESEQDALTVGDPAGLKRSVSVSLALTRG